MNAVALPRWQHSPFHLTLTSAAEHFQTRSVCNRLREEARRCSTSATHDIFRGGREKKKSPTMHLLQLEASLRLTLVFRMSAWLLCAGKWESEGKECSPGRNCFQAATVCLNQKKPLSCTSVASCHKFSICDTVKQKSDPFGVTLFCFVLIKYALAKEDFKKISRHTC